MLGDALHESHVVTYLAKYANNARPCPQQILSLKPIPDLEPHQMREGWILLMKDHVMLAKTW